MWAGYVGVDDVEIINGPRLERDLDALQVSWFSQRFKNPHLEAVLDADTYARKMSEPPPWWETHSPHSREFYGVLPIDITGFDDSTLTTVTAERVTDGSATVGRRRGGKAMTFSVTLIGSTERGAEYGLQWLKKALLGRCAGGQGCGGVTVRYMASEPLLGRPVAPAAYNLLRNPVPVGGDLWTAGGAGATKVTGVSGGWARALFTSGGGPGNAGINWTDPAGIRAVPGRRYSAAATLRSSRANRVGIYIQFLNVGGDTIGSQVASSTIAANTPLRLSIENQVAPASTHTVRVLTYYVSGTGAVVWQAGDTLDAQRVMLNEGATVNSYFAGSSVDSDTFTYSWAGAPNASRSIRRATPIADPCSEEGPFTSANGDEELRRIARYLRRVEVASAPIVNQKRRTSDGWHLWSTTFTLQANNPVEHGYERPLVDGWRNGGQPLISGAYLQNTRTLDHQVCAPTAYYPVFDPLAPVVVPPPQLDTIRWGGFTFPAQWVRSELVLPEDSLSGIGGTTPVYRFTTADVPVRGIRLRAYRDKNRDAAVPFIRECDYESDLIVTYIPPASVMTIDTLDRRVYVTNATGVVRRADSLIVSSDNGPVLWPELTEGDPFVLTYDLAAGQTAPWLEVDLVQRFG